MIPSKEYFALIGLRKPPQSSPGDMWLCRRLRTIKVMTAHKRGMRRGARLTSFHLYHFGDPALYARKCDFTENDPSAYVSDPACDDKSEIWEYVGNVFQLLPYNNLINGSQP